MSYRPNATHGIVRLSKNLTEPIKVRILHLGMSGRCGVARLEGAAGRRAPAPAAKRGDFYCERKSASHRSSASSRGPFHWRAFILEMAVGCDRPATATDSV